MKKTPRQSHTRRAAPPAMTADQAWFDRTFREMLWQAYLRSKRLHKRPAKSPTRDGKHRRKQRKTGPGA